MFEFIDEVVILWNGFGFFVGFFLGWFCSVYIMGFNYYIDSFQRIGNDGIIWWVNNVFFVVEDQDNYGNVEYIEGKQICCLEVVCFCFYEWSG